MLETCSRYVPFILVFASDESRNTEWRQEPGMRAMSNPVVDMHGGVRHLASGATLVPPVRHDTRGPTHRFRGAGGDIKALR